MTIHVRGCRGRVYRRGGVWWIAYYTHGVERRESARTVNLRTAKARLRVRQLMIDHDRAMRAAARATAWSVIARERTP